MILSLSLVSRRLLFSIFLAGVCLAVLATRVETEFRRYRYIVRSSSLTAQEPTVTVALPDLTRLAGKPTAIVLRLRGGEEPADVNVSLDTTPVARVTVPARREVRVDAATNAGVGPGQQLILTSTRSGWQLASLEVGNVYGFSNRIPKFVIVPRERHSDRAIPLWGLGLFVILALLVQPRFDWPAARIGRIVHRSAAGLVLLLFAATLLAQSFTSYKILLFLDTFIFCTAVLYAEPLSRVWYRLQPRVVRVGPVVAPYATHLTVAAMVLWSVGQLYRPETGFTTLIVFGGHFESNAVPALRAVPHHIEAGAGYDGQFYAQLALDPLLRSEAISTALDDTGYRGRRILMSWTAYVLGLGQPWYVLQAFALLNVVCWLILGVILLRWLPAGSLRPTLAWAACMLGEGLLSSMRYSLTDGPSALLLVLAVKAVETNRRGIGTGLVGLAGLTRETSLLGASLLLPDKPTPVLRSLATMTIRIVLILTPFVLWLTYLWSLGLTSSSVGLRNFAPPVTAYAEKWTLTIHAMQLEGWNSDARFSFLALVGLTTQAIVMLWRCRWQSPWWRLGAVYAILMLVLGPAVWEGHPGAIARVVIPMTIAFNVLLPRERWFWPLWILGNAGVLIGFEVMSLPWLSGW